jgi:hypothetical protein
MFTEDTIENKLQLSFFCSSRSLISGLDATNRYFRSQSQQFQQQQQQQRPGSQGSSPNTSSSRSGTPRADDQLDYDSNV